VKNQSDSSILLLPQLRDKFKSEDKRLGGKRGAGVRGPGVRGTGSRGPGVWKTRGLVENAGYHFFSLKYEFSSVKRETKILLAYIAMNINSASRPETRCFIKRAN